MGICVGICLSAVETPPYSSTQPIFYRICVGLDVGQCEHCNWQWTWTYQVMTPPGGSVETLISLLPWGTLEDSWT